MLTQFLWNLQNILKMREEMSWIILNILELIRKEWEPCSTSNRKVQILILTIYVQFLCFFLAVVSVLFTRMFQLNIWKWQ